MQCSDSHSAPTSPAAACSHAAAWVSSSGQQRTALPGPIVAAAASTTTWASGALIPDALIQRSNSPLMFTNYPEALSSDLPLSCAGAGSKCSQQQQVISIAAACSSNGFSVPTGCVRFPLPAHACSVSHCYRRAVTAVLYCMAGTVWQNTLPGGAVRCRTSSCKHSSDAALMVLCRHMLCWMMPEHISRG